MEEHLIQRGRALVLAGPQGIGKTLLARALAGAYGSFSEADGSVLHNSALLGNALATKPDTLIVGDVRAEDIFQAATRLLVSSPHILMARKSHQYEIAATPNFIFCTGDVDAIRATKEDRRFRVVYLGPAAKPPPPLRCNPGEYATITQSRTGNVGKVVQCVALAPAEWSTSSDFSMRGPRWIIQKPLTDANGRVHYSFADSSLTPGRMP